MYIPNKMAPYQEQKTINSLSRKVKIVAIFSLLSVFKCIDGSKNTSSMVSYKDPDINCVISEKDSLFSEKESLFSEKESLFSEENLPISEKRMEIDATKRLSNDTTIESFYENLLNYIGKEIYVVYAKGVPFNHVFYCFSLEEKDKIISALTEEDALRWSMELENKTTVDAILTYEKTDIKVLDHSSIKDILQERCKNPFLWQARDFWEEKLQEFHKRK